MPGPRLGSEVRFRDKVVLVTGGAANIGRGAALAFAREGARVMIADYDVIRARDTLADLQDVTEECDWARVDLRHEDQIVRMRDLTLRAFGRIDVLLNNAAMGATDAPLERISCEEWEHAFAGNVRQMFLCAKHVIPEMIRGGGGAIVNAGSIHSVVGGTASIVYGPSKSGIVSLTRHLALYYGPRGVRANCVCPGHILTPKTKELYERADRLVDKYPVGRLGAIEDVVAAYLYLASDDAKFVTGEVLMVDGGYTAH